jgi:hypothetical protein
VEENYEFLKKKGPQKLAVSWFKRSEVVCTQDIYCRALDNIIAEEFVDRPFHFMKIDAQGAEMNILKGSKSLLTTSCIGLHLELFNFPLYSGISLKDEVIEYLSDFGFKLIKEYPPHGTFVLTK